MHFIAASIGLKNIPLYLPLTKKHEDRNFYYNYMLVVTLFYILNVMYTQRRTIPWDECVCIKKEDENFIFHVPTELLLKLFLCELESGLKIGLSSVIFLIYYEYNHNHSSIINRFIGIVTNSQLLL